MNRNLLRSVMLALAIALLAACGGGSPAATDTAATPSGALESKPAAKPTEASEPTAAPDPTAPSETRELADISGSLDALKSYRLRFTFTFDGKDDQGKAQRFYTETLGFVTKHDLPVGEYRWLTVVSPEAPDEAELLLEPMSKPAAQVYQRTLYDEGVPLAAFAVDDVNAEYARLTARGVRFTMPPTPMGPTTVAIFDDTCGNLIQIYQS